MKIKINVYNKIKAYILKSYKFAIFGNNRDLNYLIIFIHYGNGTNHIKHRKELFKILFSEDLTKEDL